MRKIVQIEEKIKKEYSNLDLSDTQISQILNYIELLEKWNKIQSEDHRVARMVQGVLKNLWKWI